MEIYKLKTELSWHELSTSSKIIDAKQKQLCALYHLSVCRKSVSILHDKTHPLNFCFQYLPSGQQLKVPLVKRNVYRKSFIPTAVSVLNAKFQNFNMFHVMKYVCAHMCACTWMHACSEHYSCVCGCNSVEEARAGEWGENVSEIFRYLFYIYRYFKCTFLSPRVKGKISFLCFVY